MDLPRGGLSAREAVEFIEGKVHEGYVPIIANSMYCLRLFQEYFPLSIIAVSNPILPIALAETRKLGSNVSWIILIRNSFNCMTFVKPHDGIEDGLRHLDFFSKTLNRGLEKSRVASEVSVQVTDIAGALRFALSEAGGDSSLLVVDDVDCLWDIHDQGFLRSAVIVEYPAFLIAVSDIGVSELFHLNREPRFLIIDRDSEDRQCTAGGFARKPGAPSLSEIFQHLLTITLVDWNIIHSPLEFIIKSGGSPYKDWPN
ncbi:MAG: hypothetical protein RXR18_04795 [Nitrososphaeria archaeon]